MSIKLRLARGGSKKRPYYSIVVANSNAPRDGRFLEKIGVYDPRRPKDDERRIVLDLDKARAWLAKGAQPTDRVQRFLEAADVLPKKARANLKKAEPGKKAQERAAEKAQKLKEAAEAAAAEA